MFLLRRLLVPVLVIAALLAAPAAVSAQQHIEGKTGPGSMYVIDVPAAWNGYLVLYAHGIVQAEQPVVLPTMQDGYDQMREALLEAGYAVAASSFSSNGWALADAVQRTHQLGKLFVAKVGQPKAIILAGHSMGGLAIVKLAEQYPTQYSGALAMCTPLGGGLEEIRYAGDARLIFDYYFKGVIDLPGTVFDVPEGTRFESHLETPPYGSPLFQQVYGALASNPDKTFQWAVAAGLPFATIEEVGYSALYFLGFQLRYTNDLIERVNGKIPYDNATTVYSVPATGNAQIDGVLALQLNAGIERIVGDRAAFNYYERNYDPTGELQIPVVTLHTTRDAGVPFWHETLYAEKVAAAGSSAFLTQIPVERWGHCAFTEDEIIAAFTTLIAKVNAAAAK